MYPQKGRNIVYPALGLNGEAGEVAEKVKKIIRDKKGKMDAEARKAISQEVGDILWYCAQMATELKYSLDQIARENIEKLRSRKRRGVISGDGDKR